MTLRPCSLGTDLPPRRPRPGPTPDRGGPCKITSQPSRRIDVLAVGQRLEVQVTAGGEPGGARVGDELSAAHRTARHDPGEVVVRGREVDAAHQTVVDDHAVAVAARPAGADDR